MSPNESKGSLNRPITLDLKPTFSNTSKHSEGISLSTTSTNEDENFVMDEHMSGGGAPVSAVMSTANNTTGSYLNYLDNTNCNASSNNTASLSGGAGSFMSSSYRKQFAATKSNSNTSATLDNNNSNANTNNNKLRINTENKHLLISSSLSLSSSVASSSVPSSLSPSFTSTSPKSSFHHHHYHHNLQHQSSTTTSHSPNTLLANLDSQNSLSAHHSNSLSTDAPAPTNNFKSSQTNLSNAKS